MTTTGTEPETDSQTDRQCPDRQGPDRQGPGRQGPDRQGPDRQVPDRQSPDRQGPGRQRPDMHDPGRQGPGREGPDICRFLFVFEGSDLSRKVRETVMIHSDQLCAKSAGVRPRNDNNNKTGRHTAIHTDM